MADEPIPLTINDWCAWHMEPFRPRFPSGWGVATVRLFDALMRSEKFQDLAAPSVKNAENFEQAITALKSEIRPVCCYVGDDVMAAIYEEAKVLPPESLPRPVRRALKRHKGEPFREKGR